MSTTPCPVGEAPEPQLCAQPVHELASSRTARSHVVKCVGSTPAEPEGTSEKREAEPLASGRSVMLGGCEIASPTTPTRSHERASTSTQVSDARRIAGARRFERSLEVGTLITAAWAAPALAPHVSSLRRGFSIADRARLPGAVGLTFDDGPHRHGTPAVLEILAAHGATATFFVVGEQVRRTGALLDEVLDAGHVVAIHGDRHRPLLRLTQRMLADDFDRVTETLAGRAVALHRAPYGAYSTGALLAVRRRGWCPLLWSRWGRDWRGRATPRSVAAEVTRDLSAGDVLLLHDADDYSAPGSWWTTVAALPEVLSRVGDAGLVARVVTPDQVAGR